MKVQNRIPETDERLDRSLLEDGWSPMREPKSVMTATFFSIPLMLLNLIITIGVIQAFSPFTLEEFGFSNDSIQITLNLLVFL
ncbi:hypothetical protein [Halobacillus salinus]|uniref:hypothetical protein n=1 Tax=Halobacillus salinus TaxID=192814 RepID=UPI0030C83768